jgi:hypothetical protein
MARTFSDAKPNVVLLRFSLNRACDVAVGRPRESHDVDL